MIPRPGRPVLVLLLAALLALGGGGRAVAGAWPRAPGEVFLSLGAEMEKTGPERDLDASVYGEYGLTDRLTLVGQFTTADQPWTPSRASTALRFALTGPDAVNRFAVSLGVSSPPDLMGAMMGARLEAGVAWGRGFESRWGGGWATATARVMLARDSRQPITDLYGLVGLRPAERWMTMLALGRYADDQGVYWKLTPSVGYELRKGVQIVPSVTQELTDDRSTSLGLSLWLTF